MSRRHYYKALFLCIVQFQLVVVTSHQEQQRSPRAQVSFDFGWRHRTGLTRWALPDEEPPEDVNPGLFPPESAMEYNDSSWILVTLPHDGLIASAPSEKACPDDGCSGKSYIPRHVLWYRKKFTLPLDWKDSAIWLDFEGSFRNTTVWINGHIVSNHVCGYTQFVSPNIIAIFVDPDNGDQGARTHASGWWYEGGGLYRNVHLVRANKIHVPQDGVFAYSNVTFTTRKAIEATVHVRASIYNGITNSPGTTVCVSFQLVEPDGTVIASTDPKRQNIAADGSVKIIGEMQLKDPTLWNPSNPFLYTVTVHVEDCEHTGVIIDNYSVVHGIRTIHYTANHGFFLNQQHFKVRGFCDHNNFAVVGMAVPDRINLFRAQALRSIGGNARRTSHNPPSPIVLDIYDRLGTLVMDENRLFDDNKEYVDNMRALVMRDRNHPSVIIWSFCNEGDCEGENQKGGPAFQETTYKHDGTRPTLANMFTFNDLLSNLIDVQGFSHQSREHLDDCHKALPNKPIFMSECCSCNTMRSEDVGCETVNDNPHNKCTQVSFNARCLENTVNASDGIEYAVGTMVWTLFDYYGEPPVGGFEVSSTYGQFDLCGFPKSAAFWFRTQWLLTIPDDQIDKPFQTDGKYEVHIVESWESPNNWKETKSNKTREIHAYSNAPFIELLVNDKSRGSKRVIPMVKGSGSYAEWTAVPWESGRISARAHDTKGNELARDERFTNGKASRLAISIDAPSEKTGTGNALLLDGQDAALVRVSVLDDDGRLMYFASNNITFTVVRGPGLIQGTANGDPHCHEPNHAPWHSAYHGLVRAVVRVTSVKGRTFSERALLQTIDLDGPMSAAAFANDVRDEDDIVVEASSPGLEPVRVSIPTTTNPLASVLLTAASAAGKSIDFFGASDGHDNDKLDEVANATTE